MLKGLNSLFLASQIAETDIYLLESSNLVEILESFSSIIPEVASIITKISKTLIDKY